MCSNKCVRIIVLHDSLLRQGHGQPFFLLSPGTLLARLLEMGVHKCCWALNRHFSRGSGGILLQKISRNGKLLSTFSAIFSACFRD